MHSEANCKTIEMTAETVDLLIVGGGINGAGVARDAAGRGLSVQLVEQDDLANHTSSASTKLIHGGLRYLEYGEVRLVREALIERERLWGMAPHIIWPLRFVLPQTQSPRPAWMVRLGLFLYDHLGGRKKLPATDTIRARPIAGRRGVGRSARQGVRLFGLLGRGQPLGRAQRARRRQQRRGHPDPHADDRSAPRWWRMDRDDRRCEGRAACSRARAGQRRWPVGRRRAVARARNKR